MVGPVALIVKELLATATIILKQYKDIFPDVY